MRTALGVSISVAILLGLPLLALTVGRRLPLPRPAKIRKDPGFWLLRSLGVSGRDHLTVVEAVGQGRQVERRLRPAAVAYATRVEQQLHREKPWGRRWLLYLWLAALAAAVTALFVLPFDGFTLGYVFYFIAYPALLLPSHRRRLQRVRRAIDVNKDGSDDDPAVEAGPKGDPR